ncbi:MAG: LysE family transporter [Bacteroidia bacterium]|nr:LysE family transporter [Bacteroidia bacterium]
MNYVITVLLGAVIAFIASIPVGAVNMAVVAATLNKGRKSAFMIGIGGIIVEAIYCAVPLFSLSFNPNENSLLVKIIYMASIPLLLGLGIYTIITRKRAAIKAVRQTHTSKAGNEILYGILLCATNPMVLLFWAGITTTLTAWGWLGESTSILFAFLAGVPVGTFMLYYLFIVIAHRKKRNIGLATRAKINAVVGVIFLLLAAYLAINYVVKFMIT